MGEESRIEKVRFIKYLVEEDYRFNLEMSDGQLTDDTSLFDEYREIVKMIDREEDSDDLGIEYESFDYDYEDSNKIDPYNYYDESDTDDYWEGQRKLKERFSSIDVMEYEHPYYNLDNIKSIIITESNLSFKLRGISSIPEGIKFMNIGNIDLRCITKIPSRCEFMNMGSVQLGIVDELGENIVFRDKGDVLLRGISIGGVTRDFNEGIPGILFEIAGEEPIEDVSTSLRVLEREEYDIAIPGISIQRCLAKTMNQMRNQ